MGGTSKKGIYMTTTTAYQNVSSISFYLASNDKGKTSLQIQYSSTSDFSSGVTDIQALAVYNTLPGMPSSVSNNTFYQISYTFSTSISGYLRFYFYQPSSSGKKMWLEYSAHRFKDEFAYANQTRLEKLTIYEIRKLASKEGIELPAGRKLKAELIAEFGRQITEEDKVKMRKIGLNEAISAIEAATTEDAVRAVLENCTKAQIEEVYIAVTGNEYDKKPHSWIKASLVLYYAERIIAYKAREAFKSMTIAEKAEYLKSGK